MVKMKYYGLMVQIPFDRYDLTAVNRITVGNVLTALRRLVATYPPHNA